LLVIELIFGFIRGTKGLSIYTRFGVINTIVNKVNTLFLPLLLLSLALGVPYRVRLNISIASVIKRSLIIFVTLCLLPLALVILFLPLTFIGRGFKTGALLLLITLIGFIKC
jgi:hypothetical protein